MCRLYNKGCIVYSTHTYIISGVSATVLIFRMYIFYILISFQSAPVNVTASGFVMSLIEPWITCNLQCALISHMFQLLEADGTVWVCHRTHEIISCHAGWWWLHSVFMQHMLGLLVCLNTSSTSDHHIEYLQDVVDKSINT